jgi:hypothetical protein
VSFIHSFHSSFSNQTNLVIVPSCDDGFVGNNDSFLALIGFGLICQVRIMRDDAIVNQISGNDNNFPASGTVSTSPYEYAANAADNQTHNTPTTDVPYRRSTLLIVFHVSPIDKCNINANIVIDPYATLPDDTNNAVLTARNGPIINNQTIGKTKPGGVHSGILRAGTDNASSLSSISFVSRFVGRLFDIGLNILDFNARMKKRKNKIINVR